MATECSKEVNTDSEYWLGTSQNVASGTESKRLLQQKKYHLRVLGNRRQFNNIPRKLEEDSLASLFASDNEEEVVDNLVLAAATTYSSSLSPRKRKTLSRKISVLVSDDCVSSSCSSIVKEYDNTDSSVSTDLVGDTISDEYNNILSNKRRREKVNARRLCKYSSPICLPEVDSRPIERRIKLNIPSQRRRSSRFSSHQGSSTDYGTDNSIDSLQIFQIIIDARTGEIKHPLRSCSITNLNELASDEHSNTSSSSAPNGSNQFTNACSQTSSSKDDNLCLEEDNASTDQATLSKRNISFDEMYEFCRETTSDANVIDTILSTDEGNGYQGATSTETSLQVLAQAITDNHAIPNATMQNLEEKHNNSSDDVHTSFVNNSNDTSLKRRVHSVPYNDVSRVVLDNNNCCEFMRLAKKDKLDQQYENIDTNQNQFIANTSCFAEKNEDFRTTYDGEVNNQHKRASLDCVSFEIENDSPTLSTPKVIEEFHKPSLELKIAIESDRVEHSGMDVVSLSRYGGTSTGADMNEYDVENQLPTLTVHSHLPTQTPPPSNKSIQEPRHQQRNEIVVMSTTTEVELDKNNNNTTFLLQSVHESPNTDVVIDDENCKRSHIPTEIMTVSNYNVVPRKQAVKSVDLDALETTARSPKETKTEPLGSKYSGKTHLFCSVRKSTQQRDTTNSYKILKKRRLDYRMATIEAILDPVDDLTEENQTVTKLDATSVETTVTQSTENDMVSDWHTKCNDHTVQFCANTARLMQRRDTTESYRKLKEAKNSGLKCVSDRPILECDADLAFSNRPGKPKSLPRTVVPQFQRKSTRRVESVMKAKPATTMRTLPTKKRTQMKNNEIANNRLRSNSASTSLRQKPGTNPVPSAKRCIQDLNSQSAAKKKRVSLDKQEDLLYNPIYHEWITQDGKKEEKFGILTSRRDDNSETNYVACFYSSRQVVYQKLKNMDLDKDVDSYVELSWLDAKSMSVAFGMKLNKVSHNKKFHRPSVFHYKWIIPSSCEKGMVKQLNNLSPTVTLCIAKGKLVLFASKSQIVGAGLGLFVYFEPHQKQSKSCELLLEAGELVDLGVYGPLNRNHKKTQHIGMIKNFVHNWSCECWQFEASLQAKEKGYPIIDVTDDLTGNPCVKSLRNPLSFANETNGKEKPSLLARCGPDGKIHYYLGHESEGYGAVRIPCKDKPLELKIDYGQDYERVRCRNGYGKVSSQKRSQIQKEVDNDDQTALKELRSYELNEINDICSFLSKFEKPTVDVDSGKQCRLFVAWLTVFETVKSRCVQLGRNKKDNAKDVTTCTMLLQKATKGILHWWSDSSAPGEQSNFLQAFFDKPLFYRLLPRIISLPSMKQNTIKDLTKENLSDHLQKIIGNSI